MKRTLYYFTASYPWGMGETWKRNELRRLVPHFERVVVVPYSYAGNTTAPKKLPDGVTATPPLFNTGDPRGDHADAGLEQSLGIEHVVVALLAQR